MPGRLDGGTRCSDLHCRRGVVETETASPTAASHTLFCPCDLQTKGGTWRCDDSALWRSYTSHHGVIGADGTDIRHGKERAAQERLRAGGKFWHLHQQAVCVCAEQLSILLLPREPVQPVIHGEWYTTCQSRYLHSRRELP